ncbi:early endosome antigen 1-like isoform X2 [Mya arenaria]|uniref:early endosome antigen 1-like isoform X2 n=1 Tax=Mya arenaria TaxID=6604 RepID=UPI0022E2B447|nr:early endosome antigen 1-like isoform X2 [Mya arenaria]
MATKEKVKKKKKVQSPAVKRKTKASPLHVPVVNDSRDEEVEPEISQEQDVQGSQVSVRSAVDDNIKDNTVQNGSGRQQASTKSPKASSSDSKKPKKDHVEQKLVKGRGQKESLSDPPRSMSPVTAVQVTKMSTQGSTVSLRSNHSRASKEAWVERSENEVKVEVEEDSAEKHAYIPYLYARNCIAKITEDMKAMKTNHIIIVENIQEHYSDIETETQEQFNMFVLCIREEYSKKRNTFRQVIDAHQVELDKKEKYWNEMLTSLAERNNRLLKEKKMLLVHSKTEIERLEREKEELVQQYADEGAHRGALVAAVPQAWEEERKVLHDQLESEKATVASLRSQLASQGPVAMAQVTSGGGGMSDVARVESKQMSAAGAGFSGGALAAAGAMTAARDNKQQMEKERQEIEDERAQFSEDRAKFEEEREMFAAERAQWMGQIAQLQTELGEKSVSGNEWQVKHDIIAGRLAEVGDIQAKYLLLESQYQALAAIVKDTDTSSATKAQLEKNGEEKKMMEGEKASLDKEITQWEKQFEKANKRKPTDDDKPDSIQEMYTTRQEVEYMVTSLEQKEKTLRQVESGSVPDVPDVTHKPVDTKEPEVVTVQVKVPDPSIVEALEKSQGDIIEVRVEVTKLQEHITLLRTEISQQNTQIQTQMTHIAELEHQIASMQAEGVVGGGVMVGGTSVSQEELEKLKEENRNLRRDMKKILKQYERLAQSQADKGVPASVADDDTIATLDNKIADLEAENEALKDERLILREKVKTITETITVTHFEDNKKAVEEKDKRINDLLKELTKLREMNVSMAKDMKKMVKSHMKTKIRMDELINAEKAAKLLEKVAMQVHDIHSEVPPAAVMVNDRLEDSLTRVTSTKLILDNKQAAYQAWLDTYQKKHGKAPGKGDRTVTWRPYTIEESVVMRLYLGDALGEDIHDDWEQAKHDYKEAHLLMSALQIMKSGDVSEAVGQDDTESKAEIEIVNLEKALASADNRLLDLEASNKNVINERDRYKEKVEELEKMLEDAGKQIDFNATLLADSQSTAELTEQLGELRKKSDNFEAELMQERMSHVSTRDELETLRKQMDSLKEEMANEKQGLDAKLEASRSEMQAHITLKEEELSAKKARIEQLESEKLSKLPPDTAAEMKALQDKLRELEQDSSSSKSSTATQNAKMAELAAALEVATKNLETIRAHNRELEVKVKAGRHEKDKESKRVSRHMEEKQQKASTEDKQRIQLLVKRVKELENQLGKGVAVAPVAAAGGVGADKGDVLKLRREIKDQAAEIKRLEKEVRLAGPGGGGGSAKDQVAEKHKTAKQEKVLKEMEKRMDMEKERTAQMMAGLQAADAENSVLKKELEAKEKNVAKLTAELKTIGMAAKEGIEAAAKVKDLQHENKKLGDENVVLTKNFESERVLRKKYYNMVEDMKGKIRVYCRARPMSKTELDRGNKSVLSTADEYSIAVNASRGLKEFQYDQIFMEDSTQEKIFEDSNNLIQSAMDGYNVCIFAYGQTGSGKTFTMIGDRDQKYPGVAPRAFNRIFDLGDEMKSKFTLHVETYMMELYNDKLIDLFARPATSEDIIAQSEKLEIKKDKKGMVFVQGAVVKNARNAKELFALFEEGSANRHVASTKMNAESSRSHLIIGIILTSTNKNTGNVTKGKLSLVDLAGSERVAKTQAGAEQLKEAMSINKSLSALGDVISALSSDQQFIPYRNNKLTMLMQDSLGGNAKTLMFVNISPADYNMEETVISLTYASRVKLITNDASKNADNKEIAKLKAIISKMKKGETLDVDLEEL